MNARSFRRAVALFLSITVLGFATTPLANGQVSDNEYQNLLDLLGDSKEMDGTNSAKSAPANPVRETDSSPANKESALVSVHDQMLQVARQLAGGKAGGATQSLQADVVRLLDELLREQGHQQTQQSENSPSQAESTSQAQGNDTQSQAEDSSSDGDSGQGREGKQGGATEASREDTRGLVDQSGQEQSSASGAGPGQNGEKATEQVEPLSNRQLQESVWGQLPEQVRKQMQSNMTEQFLPSFKEQIESYFRALLKE